MKPIEKNIRVGTKVLIADSKDWCTVTEVHETRNWVKLKEWMGSFQRGHIIKYSNKRESE